MRFRPFILSAWCLAVLTLAGAGSLSAMSVVAPTFPELVAKAETIARVEVTAQSSRWDTSASGQKVIHTYVECRVIQQLKGAAQTTLSLRFLGGQVGTAVMEIPDMPTFVTGQRYIVFVADNGRAFCPLVGVMHGTYSLRTGSDGNEHVIRNSGAPLHAAVEVPVPNQAGATSVESGLKRDDFEQSIAQEVRHASGH